MAATERVTAHDVKAVEYFLKKRLTEIAPGPRGRRPRRADPLRLHQRGRQQPLVRRHGQGRGARGLAAARQALVEKLATMASDLRDVPLLAHTHGQPATPTTMGKELAVLALAAAAPARRIEDAEFLGKLNGATGTYGAHVAAVPGADWQERQPRVRRAPRPHLEPADHPDREPRLADRALRRRRPLQPGAAQHVHRRVDLHLDGLLRPGARPGHRRLARRCRTRSTRSASRTPRPTSR